MAQSIDEIIREVRATADQKQGAVTSQQPVTMTVILDREGREWQPGSFFGRSPKEDLHHCYHIILDQWSDFLRISFLYVHPRDKRKVSLTVHCRIKCPMGNGILAAKVFHRVRASRKIEDFVNKKCTQWMENRLDHFLSHHRQEQKSLVGSLVSDLQASLALESEFDIELGGDSPSMELYDLGIIPLRFKDHPHDLQVGMKMEIEVDATQIALAQATIPDKAKLMGELQAEIQLYCKGIPIQLFLEKTVRNADLGMLAKVNERLVKLGRFVARIDIRLPVELGDLFENGLPTRKLKILANDLPGERQLDLEVGYKIEAQSAAYGKNVQWLGNVPMTEAIETFIRKRIGQFWLSKIDRLKEFLLEFVNNTSELEQYLVEQFEQVAGLKCYCNIAVIAGPDVHVAVKATGETVALRPKDNYREFVFGYNATLEVDTKGKAKAIAFGPDAKKKWAFLSRQIQKVVTESLSLHQLYINQDQATHVIYDYAFQAMLAEGFVLSAFSMNPITKVDYEPTYECEDLIVRLEVTGGSEMVVTRNRIMLKVVDLGKYVALGEPDFAKWVERSVNLITKEVLFEKEYADYVVHNAQHKGEISKRIKAFFLKAGYEVLQYISNPEIEFFDLKEDFVIEREVFFKTKNHDSEVKMKISLRGQIPDLDKIEYLINRPGASVYMIQETMMNVAAARATEIIEARDAEQYYFNFASPYNTQEAKREVLAEVLKAAIKGSLESTDPLRTFGLVGLGISFQQLETEVIQRFNALQKNNPVIEFEYQPPRVIDLADRFSVRLSYSVRSVHKEGWPIFKQRCKLELEDHLEEIKKVVSNFMTARFDRLSIDQLQNLNTTNLVELEGQLTAKFGALLADQFGLVAELDSFRIFEIGANHLFGAELEANYRTELLIGHEKQRKELVAAHERKLKDQDAIHQQIQVENDKLIKLRRDIAAENWGEFEEETAKAIEERILKLREDLKKLDSEANNRIQRPPSQPLLGDGELPKLF
jgi:hypothetical protein